MRIRYTCPVAGLLRVEKPTPLVVGRKVYEVATEATGRVSAISVTFPIVGRKLWPTISPGADANSPPSINISAASLHFVRKDLRAAEGLLAAFGVESIDLESVDIQWLPDTEEEKKELHIPSFKLHHTKPDVSSISYMPFDIVARAILAGPRSHDIGAALSFFRRGRRDYLQRRNIEAVTDFLYMIESLYADGKHQKGQVIEAYTSNERLVANVVTASKNMARDPDRLRDEIIKGQYQRLYQSKEPAEILRHLVSLRGFLHHHTQRRKDIWHPDEHDRFSADALFLMHLSDRVAWDLITPKMFTAEAEAEYYSAYQEGERQAAAGKE